MRGHALSTAAVSPWPSSPSCGGVRSGVGGRALPCNTSGTRSNNPLDPLETHWRNSVKGYAGSACASVGVKGKLPYDLRRTAVRNMVRAGLDPTVAMRISGHRTRSMFDRYNIITQREIAAGLEQTAAYVDTLPSTTNIVPLRVERTASR